MSIGLAVTFLTTFTLDQGKKSAGGDDGDVDYMGEFKGALVAYPLPADRSVPHPKKFFNQVPTGDVKEVVVRVYVVKCTGLQPMDDNGKVTQIIRYLLAVQSAEAYSAERTLLSFDWSKPSRG